MKGKLPRFLSAALVVIASVAMLGVADDAEARRMGGGSSFGRQSSNIMRTPSTSAPVAPAARPNQMSPSATSGAATAAARPKTGFSRFLGPIAGIAAGLGIAALLSSLGLSGAFLEFMSSLVLIGLVVFGVMFVLRRLRGAPQTAGASANTSANNTYKNSFERSHPVNPNSGVNSSSATFGSPVAPAPATDKQGQDNWFIPADFDKVSFLQEAKKQYVAIQALSDQGNIAQLQQYLTDDLLRELTPSIQANAGGKTEIVLLNAELLGIEKIHDTQGDGHLASVRFSGMVRENVGEATTRFEEVWNLYKAANSGWLLAGIQQFS
ncbi:hypothetical protein V757_10325 [Pelistega indica]|uniref:Tim44-like domain-containing protein n=1 Tax=Pelistega indica TaxID=1414851 RepID=V8FWT4_9BURK|nr:TIM44-like domain-containing protein [Pelistega indica]ETD68336.1 hypothetical protein V757_10325 [Pelistega indica]